MHDDGDENLNSDDVVDEHLRDRLRAQGVPGPLHLKYIPFRAALARLVRASGGDIGDLFSQNPWWPLPWDKEEPPSVQTMLKLSGLHQLARAVKHPAAIGLSNLIDHLASGTVAAVVIRRDRREEKIPQAAWQSDPGERRSSKLPSGEEHHWVAGEHDGCVLLRPGLKLASWYEWRGERHDSLRAGGDVADVAGAIWEAWPILIEREGLEALVTTAHAGATPATQTPPRSPTDAEIDMQVDRYKGRLGPLKVDVLRALLRFLCRNGRCHAPDVVGADWDAIDVIFTDELDGTVETTDSKDGGRLTASRGAACDRKGLRYSATLKPTVDKIMKVLLPDS